MAKRGRPKNTKDLYTLVNRMLDKKHTLEDGTSYTRRDKLVDLLWSAVVDSEGKNTRALHTLLDYAGGKPVTMDKLPEDDNETLARDNNLLDTPEHLIDIISEIEKKQ